MASQLPTIIAAIKAFSLTYNGKSISIRDGSTIPNTANAADLPMRIISAVDANGGNVKRYTFGANPVITLRWQVTDTMLGQQVGLGKGEKDQSTAQIAYAATYANLIRGLVTNTYQIDDITITPGTIEYPSESGNMYYGVTCEYIVTEIIQ